jgi:hypothetical protein
MRRYLLGKTLALGVVVLFIGVGIHPAFAVEEKESTYNNEKPTAAEDKIYENTNCFIKIYAKEIRFQSKFFALYLHIGNLSFGTSKSKMGSPGWHQPANGKFYTRGEQGEWEIEGLFYGLIKIITRNLDGFYDFEYRYVGAIGFRGITFFPLIADLFDLPLYVFGYADYVKIGRIRPDLP